jgi:hypothetical protein
MTMPVAGDDSLKRTKTSRSTAKKTVHNNFGGEPNHDGTSTFLASSASRAGGKILLLKVPRIQIRSLCFSCYDVVDLDRDLRTDEMTQCENPMNPSTSVNTQRKKKSV